MARDKYQLISEVLRQLDPGFKAKPVHYDFVAGMLTKLSRFDLKKFLEFLEQSLGEVP